LPNIDNLIVGFVGNVDQCPSFCTAQPQLPTPNNNVGANGMVSLIAHELSESATDPLGTGWINPDGTENGDTCTFTYGNYKPAPQRFLLQREIWHAPVPDSANLGQRW
jgi:hypothetical protein